MSFIGVPIRIGAKVVGTLTIDRVWDGRSVFRLDSDVRFLTMIANLIGQTVQLYRVVSRDRERLMAESHRLQKELSELKPARERKKVLIKGIIGDSAAMRSLLDKIMIVAKSNSTVLLRGESGTGKELIAKAIHELSPRAKGPFIKINCAALPESVLESELFGHEKGAFTGAINARKGRFELADKGTMFLDEIGEISPGLSGQAAARPAGAGIRARRRQPHHQGRCARRHRDQQKSRRGGVAQRIPRRSLLSHQRGADADAAAARAAQRHPAAGG